MKYPIAIEALLRRVVVIEADSEIDAVLTAAQCHEQEAIVLSADDLVPDPTTGSLVNIYPADWYDKEMMKDLTYIKLPSDNENDK